MSQTVITKKDIKDSLRKLEKPAQLEESKLVSSCLVQTRLQKGNPILSLVIKEVLSDVLDLLKEDKAEYAEILKERFWDEYTAEQMALKKNISRSKFFNLQRKADERFASIFMQKEEACLQNQQAVEAKGNEPEPQVPAEEATIESSKPIEQESKPPVTESVPDDDQSSLLDAPLAPVSLDCATNQPELAADTNAIPLAKPEASFKQTVSPTDSGSILPSSRDELDSVQKQPKSIRSIGPVIVLVVLVGVILFWIANQFVIPSADTAQNATETALEPSFVATSLATQNVDVMPTEAVTEPTSIVTSSATQNAEDVAPVTAPTTSPTVPSKASICGEETRRDKSTLPGPTFLPDQGVIAFNVENTPDVILNNNVRSVAIDSTGLWIGYYADDLDTSRNGLTHFNNQAWADCNQVEGPKGKNVQEIAFDSKGHVWVAAEGRVSGGGVSRFDGKEWYTYTTEDGLPSNDTFGLTIDENDDVWVATWLGMAKFDGKKWSTPYSQSNDTIFDDHIHAMAVDKANNIWVGHINQGVSLLKAGASEWVHHTTETELGGNEIRSIAIRPATESSPESVWLATADGGITKYEQETWTIYNQENGLPGNGVEDVAIDKYNRVWVATTNGVVYLTDSGWVTYNTLKTRSIAFGPACEDCPFDDEKVWTGTFEMGATYSRLPYPDAAIDVLKACVERTGQEPTCHTPTDDSNGEIAIIPYPEPLTPGEEVRLEIRVAPRSPYELREDRGDLLTNLAPTEEERYGTWIHILAKGLIHSGEPFAFTDHEFLLKVPNLANGETFSSTWRVWMHTRYTGPKIQLQFTVGE